jgi:hypothetical protein
MSRRQRSEKRAMGSGFVRTHRGGAVRIGKLERSKGTLLAASGNAAARSFVAVKLEGSICERV